MMVESMEASHPLPLPICAVDSQHLIHVPNSTQVDIIEGDFGLCTPTNPPCLTEKQQFQLPARVPLIPAELPFDLVVDPPGFFGLLAEAARHYGFQGHTRPPFKRTLFRFPPTTSHPLTDSSRFHIRQGGTQQACECQITSS